MKIIKPNKYIDRFLIIGGIILIVFSIVSLLEIYDIVNIF